MDQKELLSTEGQTPFSPSLLALEARRLSSSFHRTLWSSWRVCSVWRSGPYARLTLDIALALTHHLRLRVDGIFLLFGFGVIKEIIFFFETFFETQVLPITVKPQAWFFAPYPHHVGAAFVCHVRYTENIIKKKRVDFSERASKRASEQALESEQFGCGNTPAPAAEWTCCGESEQASIQKSAIECGSHAKASEVCGLGH